MNEPRPPRALVVEADPSLRELFEVLLEGWELRVISTAVAPPAESVDLLIFDNEDLSPGSIPEIPSWLSAWQGRPPTIVFRPGASPKRLTPSTLALPKPFPVSLFLAFTELARASRTGEV